MGAFDFLDARVGGIGFLPISTRGGVRVGQAVRQLRCAAIFLFYLYRLPNASRKRWRFVKTMRP
jgi:hypothetical protein